MTIHEHKGHKVSVRHFSHEELCKIDECLPHTGASQEAGFYWDELDEDGELGAPSGPYASEDEALAEYIKFADRAP
jgi:hypothetical protein